MCSHSQFVNGVAKQYKINIRVWQINTPSTICGFAHFCYTCLMNEVPKKRFFYQIAPNTHVILQVVKTIAVSNIHIITT